MNMEFEKFAVEFLLKIIFRTLVNPLCLIIRVAVIIKSYIFLNLHSYQNFNKLIQPFKKQQITSYINSNQ